MMLLYWLSFILTILVSAGCQNQNMSANLISADGNNQGQSCARPNLKKQIEDQNSIFSKIAHDKIQKSLAQSSPKQKVNLFEFRGLQSGKVLKKGTSLILLVDRSCAKRFSSTIPLNQIQLQLRQTTNSKMSKQQSVIWNLPADISLEQLSTLAKSIDCIQSISPNLPIEPTLAMTSSNQKSHQIPNDSLYPELHHLHAVRQPEIFNKLFASPIDSTNKILVAVIDTGNDRASQDMIGQHWQNEKELVGTTGVDDDGNGFVDDIFGWNFFANTADVAGTYRPFPHGEHVAGLIGALLNNNLGVAGIAGPRVSVMHVNIFGSGTPGIGEPDPLASLEEAIRYATDMGAKVINLSLGRDTVEVQTTIAALKYATDNGVLVVAAAGNNSREILKDTFPFAPAIYAEQIPGMLSVGAMDANPNGVHARCGFSNFSTTYVDIAAPGCDTSTGIIDVGRDGILSVGWTRNDGSKPYIYMAGTSMATPLVVGAAGLVISYIREKSGVLPTNYLVEEILKSGSKKQANLASYVGGGGRTLDLPTLFKYIDQEILHLPNCSN